METIIKVENLRKVYRLGTEKVIALGNVNLEIHKGEICCILGTSGSGKSTLLNMLAGLEKPTKGHVYMLGKHDIPKMNEKQLAKLRQKHVGFVFQSYNLLPALTALENVGMPLLFRGVTKSKRDKAAKEMLRRVGLENRGKLAVTGASPVCDALITNTPGMALYVSTADCTPILLWDSVTGAVGAVHAGWRGTAAAIGAKTVEAMVREFGSKPENIRAAIGPNIGFCHFETDADVPEAMVEAFGEAVQPFIRRQGNKYYVNLKEINALVLRRAGVTRIEISDSCTMCQPERFWSHRVTQGQRGAQGGIIVCKEVQP